MERHLADFEDPRDDHLSVGVVFAMNSLKYCPGTSERRHEFISFFNLLLNISFTGECSKQNHWVRLVNSENCLYLKQT